MGKGFAGESVTVFIHRYDDKGRGKKVNDDEVPGVIDRGLLDGELQCLLLIIFISARLTEYMGLNLQDHWCPHRMVAATL